MCTWWLERHQRGNLGDYKGQCDPWTRPWGSRRPTTLLLQDSASRAASVHPLFQVPCGLRARGAVTTPVQVHTASTSTQGTAHTRPGPTFTALTHTRGKTQPEATTGQVVS